MLIHKSAAVQTRAIVYSSHSFYRHTVIEGSATNDQRTTSSGQHLQTRQLLPCELVHILIIKLLLF